MITGYSVTYSCNNCSSPFGNETVEANNRTFTASKLIPRTNYTFEVRAFHSNKSTILQLTGLPTEVTRTTEIPEGNIGITTHLLCSYCIINDSAAVGFFLRGVLYPNNSVVSLTDIGEGYNALHCLTNLTTCCRERDGDGAGEWFLPGQTSPVVDVNAPNASFTRSRGPSAVLLNRRAGVMGPTGLFTCHVPDGEGSKTLYIGVNLGNIACAC